MRSFIVSLIAIFVLAACNTNAPSSIAYDELPETGDAINGEVIFNEQNCTNCHVEGATGAPTLDNYSEVAGTRVEGQSAHEYTFYSIVEPSSYVVDGYGNAMPNRYDDLLTAQDIADLIAYLLQ